METPVYDFVTSYKSSGMSRFHMPGHKGQQFLGCEERDITEIEGADVLSMASGIIARSQFNASRLFVQVKHFTLRKALHFVLRQCLWQSLQMQ